MFVMSPGKYRGSLHQQRRVVFGETPDEAERIKVRFSYNSFAGGRELVELCLAAMPAHNTTNGVLFSLGRPTTGRKLTISIQHFLFWPAPQNCGEHYRRRSLTLIIYGIYHYRHIFVYLYSGCTVTASDRII